MKAAAAAPETKPYLARYPHDRYKVTALDSELLRVTFFSGPRVVLDVAVAADKSVAYTQEYPPGYRRAGSEISHRWWVLAALTAAFILAAASLPPLSLRNLDLLALASFLGPMLLLDARLFELSVYLSYPPLAYLAARCLWVGLAGAGYARSGATSSLYERLTARSSAAARERMLALASAAAAAIVVIVTLTSRSVVDVGIASIAGATQLLEGTLPYGNLPDQLGIVHGDTYPLLSYLAYLPAALLLPVHDPFDSFDGALITAAAAALAAAVGIYWAVTRLPLRVAPAARRALSRTAGMRSVLAWFTFPPVLMTTSSGSNDLVAAALVAWALALACQPAGSTLIWTFAGWVKLVPLAALPLWLGRFRGGSGVRAVGAAAIATAAVAAMLVALGGAAGVGDMLSAVSFQFERGSLLSLWSVTGLRAGQIVVQAALVATIVLAAARVMRDSELAADPWRLAGIAGAIMLGLQIAANYWTYAYLVWVFPCVALALLFRPAPGQGQIGGAHGG